jgi:hypothetical protein
MRDFHVTFSAVSAVIVAWAGAGCGGDENGTTAAVDSVAQPLSWAAPITMTASSSSRARRARSTPTRSTPGTGL